MKNILNNSQKAILVVTLLVASLSFASEASFSRIKDDAKKTALTLTDVKVGNQLTIKDAYGAILYSEQIKSTGSYTKGFDFTSLPNGRYFFELDKEIEIKTIPFIVNARNVTIEKNKEFTNFKPQLRQQNNLLFVSKLSPNFKAVKISVYANNDSNYELLLSENIVDKQTVERVYRLEKGNYKIVINSDNKEYTKFINN